MGGANVTGLTAEQGGALVRSLREEYEAATAAREGGGEGGEGDREGDMPSALLQEILTNKFRKVTEEFDGGSSLGDSLTYSIASEDDRTTDMLRTLTLKGTHFLDLMNFFESDDKEFDSHVEEGDNTSNPKEIDPWTQTMDMRSGEVEFLLRRPLCSDEDITGTLAAGEAGLQFLNELNRVAESLKINRGTLSRWLLPFDSNTSITEQQSDANSVEDNTPSELKGKITSEQLKYLVSGVNGVRQLVRVKIADDNDLETATAAVRTTTDFLTRLKKAAQEMNDNGQSTTPYELLQSHQFV